MHDATTKWSRMPSKKVGTPPSNDALPSNPEATDWKIRIGWTPNISP
jgi:hypothetical protein